ncbi:MAG: hypothetical protein KME40_12615 [Komarekiella atlantica HA4396-MV6]|jgi:hypothetical protein|nr:hypothetical protein [Komarekiella atlantica HA4396-MV6]
MVNKRGNARNLIPYLPKWRHLPTKAIRVPEIFAQQVLQYARQLDAQKPDKRIEIRQDFNAVVVISPCDPRGTFQIKARSIQGWRFHRESQSWWYPMEKIEEVVAAFPECVLDENVKDAVAVIQAKRALQWQLKDLN